MILRIEDNTGEVKQSILDALRREFDEPKTHRLRLIEIMNTTKHLDQEKYAEMHSDLLGEGIIKD